MAKLILNIDDELKQTYKEVLDKGLDNKSDRPYYALFRYNGYHVLGSNKKSSTSFTIYSLPK